ncbi:MAG: hypothetical protein EBU90_19850 [Proteobacteria bacterium]|nr:hypothetical protein [Pseudomonadota bacterium]
MAFNNEVKLTGMLTINRFDSTGALVESVEHKNLIVTNGKNFIASRMAGTTSAVMSHMAVGTGTTAAGVTDTALNTQTAIVALTSTTATDNTVTYTATFGAGVGTGALTEAGIFNAASAGTMLCRTVFPTINKQAADSISITWVVTIS